MQSFRYLFFLLVALYIYIVIFFGLPAVHPWHDPLVVRDTGTVWEFLSWKNQGNGKYSLPAAVICHIEGPLQFLFLNGYYYLIGNIVPLNPTTTQIPHVVLTFLCTIFFYLIGKRVHSEKFGYLCVLMFVLVPWLPITARRTEVFNLFSVLFELAALYFYLGYIHESESRLYRIAAPVSLALYLTGPMDWPSFFMILAIFLALNKKLFQALKNPYNILPILVVFTYILFSGTFYFGEMPCNALGIFLKPFEKVFSAGSGLSSTPLSSMLRFGHRAFGLGGLLAIIGLILFFLSKRVPFFQQASQTTVQKNFFIAMSIWLLVFCIPLFKFAATLSLDTSLRGFLTYAYILGIPVTIFSALVLSKGRKVFLTIGVVCLMIWAQWYVIITNGQTFSYGNHDRRVLAAATFLIEQRSDLLKEGRLALLPGDHARSIGQYARGQNLVISMFADFPKYIEVKIRENSGRVVGGIAGEIILSYQVQGKLKVDWLILTPELLYSSPENSSFEFYRRLSSDPQIHWVACFKDNADRKLWLGEVKSEGTPIEMAKEYHVDPLADVYEEKYNRIRFLKKNVKYILHY